MSGLCGWAGYAASEDSRRTLLERMGSALSSHDGSELATRSSVGCGVAGASLHGDTDLCQEQGVLAAITGRPQWQDPALAETARRHGHARALAEAYLARKTHALDQLRGAFALAVVREGEWEALLATDRLGTLPLAYAFRQGCLVFGSSGGCLQAHPRAESEIDLQSIFNYFFFCQVPAPGTIRKAHRRLLPGHCLVLQKGRIEVRAYARPEFTEQKRPVRVLEQEFRDVVRAGVERAAAGTEVGCFLSGGTDSSTVAGMLSGLLEGPVRTYSIGFGAQGYDEMEFARCAAERFGTDHHEYYVTPDDVLAAVPRIAQVHSDPFANESAVPTYFCARLAAQDGVHRLLAGDGGDELFGGNERYAKMRVFGHYERVPRSFQKLMERFLYLPGVGGLWPVRKARSYVSQARTPMPERLFTYNLLLRFGPENVFEPEFLAAVDPHAPIELARHVYRSARAQGELNRMLAYDYKFTLADNDLPKVNRSCELAGVQVAYPFLDDDVVDFAGRLPARMKLRGKKLRWLFKHALRNFLPKKILTKSKHGFGLPFGVWLKSHDGLQQLAGDSIASLKGRGIVRPSFADDVMHRHRNEHAAYYGVMVWMLIMLEQWYEVHQDQPAAV